MNAGLLWFATQATQFGPYLPCPGWFPDRWRGVIGERQIV